MGGIAKANINHKGTELQDTSTFLPPPAYLVLPNKKVNICWQDTITYIKINLSTGKWNFMSKCWKGSKYATIFYIGENPNMYNAKTIAPLMFFVKNLSTQAINTDPHINVTHAKASMCSRIFLAHLLKTQHMATSIKYDIKQINYIYKHMQK